MTLPTQVISTCSPITSLEFDDCNQSLLIGNAGGRITSVSLNSGQQTHSFAYSATPRIIRMSPQGDRVAIAGETNRILITSPFFESCTETQLKEDFVNCIAWHPISDLIAVGGSSGIIWLIEPSGSIVTQISFVKPILGLDWSANGETLWASAYDGYVGCWFKNELTISHPTSRSLWSIFADSDIGWLAGSDDGQVHTPCGPFEHVSHDGAIAGLKRLHGALLATLSHDESIKIWFGDQLIRCIYPVYPAWSFAFASNSDGSHLAYVLPSAEQVAILDVRPLINETRRVSPPTLLSPKPRRDLVQKIILDSLSLKGAQIDTQIADIWLRAIDDGYVSQTTDHKLFAIPKCRQQQSACNSIETSIRCESPDITLQKMCGFLLNTGVFHQLSLQGDSYLLQAESDEWITLSWTNDTVCINSSMALSPSIMRFICQEVCYKDIKCMCFSAVDTKNLRQSIAILSGNKAPHTAILTSPNHLTQPNLREFVQLERKLLKRKVMCLVQDTKNLRVLILAESDNCDVVQELCNISANMGFDVDIFFTGQFSLPVNYFDIFIIVFSERTDSDWLSQCHGQAYQAISAQHGPSRRQRWLPIFSTETIRDATELPNFLKSFDHLIISDSSHSFSPFNAQFFASVFHDRARL